MAKAKKEIALDLLECPVCMDTMTVPIFQCQSGHSLCNKCTATLLPPICPICRQPLTQMRNWKLEEIVLQVKLPCPNQSSGCTYTTSTQSNVDDHLKGCIFRQMECPLSAVFGRCSWRGELKEMSNHFQARHPDNCIVNADTDVVLNNINVADDDRRVFLFTQGKFNFIITMKFDTMQKMSYWIIQYIGIKAVAHQHIYEIHVQSGQDDRRKVVFTEHCPTDSVKIDDIVSQGKCGIMPLDYLSNFVKDRRLKFRFFIKDFSGPPKHDKEAHLKPHPGPKGSGSKSANPKGSGPRGKQAKA